MRPHLHRPAVSVPLLVVLAVLTLPRASRGADAGVATGAAAAPAATAAMASTCGDGLLTGAETCESCPADCQASSCPTKGRRKVTVDLTPQSGYESVGAVTILLAYRHGVLSLPGEKSAPAVKARVRARDPKAQVFVNDLGYALRVVLSSQQGLPAGPLVDVDLDTCGGATPAIGDVACRVEACAQGGGRLPGCTCDVHLP